MQIKKAEHSLQKISGNTITTTKKKKIIYAKDSNELPCRTTSYTKPDTYQKFVEDLISACKKGDADSRTLLQELTPHFVSCLQKHEEWLSPALSVEVSDDVPVIVRDEEWSSLLEPPENIFDKLIASTMGPDLDLEDATMETEHCSPDDTHDETNEALGNLLKDAEGTLTNDMISNSGKAKH